MTSQEPQVGEVSSDGRHAWNGSDELTLARGTREPTSWTSPLRRVVAAYLILTTVESIVSTALFISMDSLERSTRADNPSMSEDQLREVANFAFAADWITALVLGAVMVLLAIGSLRGWRWAFWAVLVWLALSSLLIVNKVLAIMRGGSPTEPLASLFVDLVFSLVGLALLVWIVVAAVRYGPWAMRRPGPARPD